MVGFVNDCEVVHGRGNKRIKRVDFGINGVVGKEKKEKKKRP